MAVFAVRPKEVLRRRTITRRTQNHGCSPGICRARRGGKCILGLIPQNQGQDSEFIQPQKQQCDSRHTVALGGGARGPGREPSLAPAARLARRPIGQPPPLRTPPSLKTSAAWHPPTPNALTHTTIISKPPESRPPRTQSPPSGPQRGGPSCRSRQSVR